MERNISAKSAIKQRRSSDKSAQYQRYIICIMHNRNFHIWKAAQKERGISALSAQKERRISVFQLFKLRWYCAALGALFAYWERYQGAQYQRIQGAQYQRSSITLSALQGAQYQRIQGAQYQRTISAESQNALPVLIIWFPVTACHSQSDSAAGMAVAPCLVLMDGERNPSNYSIKYLTSDP